MEKIKEAIEKATAARREVARCPQAAEKPSAKALVMRGSVEHTNIRVVDPQPKALVTNRLLAFGNSQAGFAGFDVLRTRVLQIVREQGWRAIAITSPGPEVGKTFVALNLAASIARLAEEIPLLVDFDFRKPAIARMLGISPKPSLYDCVVRQTALADVLVRTPRPPLAILPNARPIPHPSETIASPEVKAMVEDLKSGRDWSVVLFDLPPMLANDDVLAFLPNVDCTLLVVALGLTKVKEIEACSELLMPYNFLGYVANRSEEKAKHYDTNYGIELKADF